MNSWDSLVTGCVPVKSRAISPPCEGGARVARRKVGLARLLRTFGHAQLLLRFEVAFVVRGSPDPARVPDRRSPYFGVCFESAHAFGYRAYDEIGRPSVRYPGGVVRPAPNTRRLGAFINRNRTNAKRSDGPSPRGGASERKGYWCPGESSFRDLAPSF